MLPQRNVVTAAVIAGFCAVGTFAAPGAALADGGVDLRPVVSEVTFGAGSAISVVSFAVQNAGGVTATDITVTVDLISDTSTPALTFTPAQRGDCTVASPSRLLCPMPDAPAGGSSTPRYGNLTAWAIEAHPTPGSGGPTPMPMRIKISAAAAENEVAPADNVVTSAPIMRTVMSGPTDWAVEIPPTAGKVGETVAVQFGLVNRGPSEAAIGETILTYVAPSGTEWASGFIQTGCIEIRSRIEYRCTSTVTNPANGVMSFFTRPLTILDTAVGEGQFRVEGMGGEVNPADNTASIVIHLDDGAPADPTPTASVSSPDTGAPGNGGGLDLPTTGAHTALTAAAGATILAIGAALLLLSRRRRITVQTPTDH